MQDGYRTAGVIVREVGGGPNPVIQILEIGKLNSKRHPSEILPFLSAFRGFLNPLPNRAADMTLKVFKIPIADIECVTNTIVKLSGPTWYLNIKKGCSQCIWYKGLADISLQRQSDSQTKSYPSYAPRGPLRSGMS